ncbi:MAG TPA: site-2 protease family protein [Clostridiaceae bacterium]|nr:site-2 protease family protein [Clostridiaceae bacterium]
MFRFDITEILISLPGIVIGLAFHEFAHALMSDRLGDPTPRSQGRLTLSPLPHIDPIGFFMLIFMGFGWARPVQINTKYYKKPRRDSILVSAAGPFTNLIIAAVFVVFARLFLTSGLPYNLRTNIAISVLAIFDNAIWINIILFIFNLLPVPPLDGFHIVSNLIPLRHYKVIYVLERYGSIILIILILTGATSSIISKPAQFIYDSLFKLFSL